MPGRAGNLGALRGPAASPPEAACRHLQPGRLSDAAVAPAAAAAATAPPPASSPGGSRAAVNPRSCERSRLAERRRERAQGSRARGKSGASVETTARDQGSRARG